MAEMLQSITPSNETVTIITNDRERLNRGAARPVRDHGATCFSRETPCFIGCARVRDRRDQIVPDPPKMLAKVALAKKLPHMLC